MKRSKIIIIILFINFNIIMYLLFRGSGTDSGSGSGAGDDRGSGAGDDRGSGAGDDRGSGAGDDRGSGAGDDRGSGAGDGSGSDKGDDFEGNNNFNLDTLIQNDRNEIINCSSEKNIRAGVGLDRIGLGISYDEVEDKIYFILPLRFNQPVRINGDFNYE
jgi:hypothetical protein